MNELKNYQEIRQYVIAIEERIYEINQRLSNRMEHKNKKELKKELGGLKQDRNKYVQLIDSLTTFPKESLLAFFKEYLPLLESSKVEFRHLEKEDAPKNVSKITQYFLLDVKEEADVISNFRGIKKIEQLFNTCDIYSAYKKANLKKGFYLEGEEIHLSDGVSLKHCFASYKSVEYAFERLIDLGLEDEKMNSQERLDALLCEVKGNKEENIKRAMHLKKQTIGD